MPDNLLSTNLYSRKEAEEKIKGLSWFNASDPEIQKQVLDLPEDYNGFLNDLADRGEINNELVILKLNALYLAETSVVPVFQVKSNFSGKTYERTFVTYRKGRHHAMRGLVLIESGGEISHFLVRKCSRFEVNRMVYESIGSIYPPSSNREDKQFLSAYVEEHLTKILRLPKIETARFIDLGNVNPDGSVADLIIRLFAIVIKTDNVENLGKMVCGKEYDKGYLYSFEMLPISEFFNFLGKTDDGYLLSIFGRLQALNVIKL